MMMIIGDNVQTKHPLFDILPVEDLDLPIDTITMIKIRLEEKGCKEIKGLNNDMRTRKEVLRN